MKSFVVVLASLVFLIVAALHGYRIYAGIPVLIGGHALSMALSWYGGIGAAVLALLLLGFARK